jgi:hypothetical protein
MSFFFIIDLTKAGRYDSDIGFREDRRGGRDNPFDNFPPVSYDNASTRQAKKAVFVMAFDPKPNAAVAQLVERRIRNA